MEKYVKGAVFQIETNSDVEKLYTVVDRTGVNSEEYILAVPVEQNGDDFIANEVKIIAFKINQNESLSIETDEAIISQIVNNIYTNEG